MTAMQGRPFANLGELCLAELYTRRPAGIARPLASALSCGKPVMMIVDPNSLTAEIMEPDSTTGSAGPNQNSDPALR
jgi:hypothetical protein